MPLSENITKRITVDLKKVIERVLTENQGLFAIRDEKPYKLSIHDRDPLSDFHFGIVNESVAKAGHHIEYTRKPYSSNNRDEVPTTQPIAEFENNLKEWFNNLRAYNEESIFDDYILKGYQEEFYNDFKIIDDDADIKGFNYSQQLFLAEYLQRVTTKIEEVKDERNVNEIEELKNEALKLSKNLTKETKNETIKHFASLWAKARKSGIMISELMIKEFFKEGAKALFKFAIENAHKAPLYLESFFNSPH